MIVVSNTSPLTNLAMIGQFHLLQELYGQIWIPDAVWNELNADGIAWPGSSEASESAWVKRRQISNHNLVKILRQDLDAGEAEAIALSLEMKADLLILDEKEGRRATERLGLKVSGVLGLLIEAKAQSKTPAVQPHLENLRNRAGFFISERIVALTLHLANERKE